ncbi:IclR family transcriptional regulator [Ramlibacter sp. AW1]|uniref:IclR family transcriptional regulator n=1 Tax=Ramlibacter aurantiacus TaxID=2801330 RepID=A0A937D397_9BURK|nr:IclR family transcriptional regulator [Ramlibacter aurantiacus]MBL0419092.1 IclR family transcriptional regulator [Ramlibacter aurantiacus]
MKREASLNEEEPTVRQVASVSRALQMLELLVAHPEHELGVSEMAREIGVVKSSAHQLLATLVAHGFVESNTATGRYRLGLRLMEAGAVAAKHFGFGPAVVPLLEALVAQVHETCSLGVLVGSSVSLVQRVEAESVLRVDLKVGTRFPAHHSAIGRVIMAGMPPDRLTPMVDSFELSRSERQALLKELDVVRREGCSIVRDIPVEGISAMAVPVRTSAEPAIAGLVVAAPSFRFNPKAWRGPLFSAAAAISARGDRRL